MKRQRIHSLDSLRGISCCVLALLWHYLNMQSRSLGMPFESLFHPFYWYGQYFVELFFMISGFVIAYCYYEKIKAGEDFFTYIAKRYKHLYPLFFVTLMVMLVMQVLYSGVVGNFYVYQCSVWHLILNILCIQTGWLTMDQSFNGPAWCISVEIMLYIMYYATTHITKKDKNLYHLVNIGLFVCATALLYRGIGPHPLLNEFTVRGISCFYAGVLLCELNDFIKAETKQLFALYSLILLVVLRLLLCISPYSFWESEHYGRLALILFQWPILLFGVINCRQLRKVLEIKPLLYLGNISMDIFLWHIPVQITIKTVDKIAGLNINYGSPFVWAFYSICVLLVSAVSHHFIKGMAIKRYFLTAVGAAIACVAVIFLIDVAGIRLKPVFDSNLSYENASSVIELQKGTTLEETFYVDQTVNVEKIQFYTITWNKSFSEQQMFYFRIRDLETGENVYRGEQFIHILPDGRTVEAAPDREIVLEDGHWYSLEFTTNTQEGEEVMALMLTNQSNNEKACTINGVDSGQHLAAKIWVR